MFSLIIAVRTNFQSNYNSLCNSLQIKVLASRSHPKTLQRPMTATVFRKVIFFLQLSSKREGSLHCYPWSERIVPLNSRRYRPENHGWFRTAAVKKCLFVGGIAERNQFSQVKPHPWA
jgi:hypothetical protein